MSTSGQFLTVPPLSHRSSQHRRRESIAAATQSPRTHHSAAGNNVASSSKLRLDDNTPLGIPVSAAPPASRGDTDITRPPPPHTSSLPQASQTPARRRRTLPSPSPLATTTTPSPSPSSNIIPPTNTNPTTTSAQSPQLSPRSIFRAMPFLLRLRSPPSDLLNLTYTSGGPCTHTVLSKSRINKAPQAMTYSRTLVCADAVNAEVLLRLARNELLERAQRANRHVTALVDEEWRYTIRQTKSGDYNVEVFYSACPAQCESQNSDVPVDPRKPVALSLVTNIPGLMRVVHSE